MTKDSRLEKFLKALCSLDYSDLPTPLSRVEVLWNCLITGEVTPDFQPQSRTEKYLMTILGVYDLEDIPKPISRAETLLYKLATGDTDVELEDGAKSRYERLLSEIVANGGVGDNVDFEYVTYVLSGSFNTLYNTVETSVKSAFLKGNTIKNLTSNKDIIFQQSWDGGLGKQSSLSSNTKRCSLEVDVKPNTTYSIYSTTELYIRQATVDRTIIVEQDTWTTGFRQLTTTTNVNKLLIAVRKLDSSSYTDIQEAYGNVIVEGDYIIDDYFDGIQSVKMPVLTTIGKNLFDKTNITENYSFDLDKIVWKTDWFVSDYIPVRPNNDYKLIKTSRLHIFDKDKNMIDYPKPTDGIFTTPPNASFIRINGELAELDIWQVEEGSITTSYESFKSDILTTPEEVELNGIGEVRDELDLITGSGTRRICKYTFTGDEHIYTLAAGRFGIVSLSNDLIKPGEFDINFLCDGFNTISYNKEWEGGEGVAAYNGPDFSFIFRINNLVNKSDFIKWLLDNQVTVYYMKAEPEAISTYIDGELKTFDDITHVSLSSEGLIPEAEMTVATKNLDDISRSSTMSLRMNDISDRQNELQNEVDMQSESIDSTMMATTEIYEQTL